MVFSAAVFTRFLSTLSAEIRASLLKHAKHIDLPVGTVLYEPDSMPSYGHFPVAGLASLVTVMPSGESAEVGFVGSEGLIGSMHLLGGASLSSRCVVQLKGSALRVPFGEIQRVFEESSELRSRVLAFVQQQFETTAQVAGCNRLHGAQQRLVRWLLMAQDRTGYETLAFTHEYLSQMIGTQRTTVTLIAGTLQERGLIHYSRGKIQIVDRPRLESLACACCPIIKRLFEDFVGS